MGWLLNIVYALAVVLTAPLWLGRMIRHGKYRRDWPARLGRIPRRYGLQPVIWIHGVSVGEISAARTLVQQLHSQLPDFRVVISSTTDTGMATAGRLFAPDHTVFRWPLDLGFAVNAALDRMSPAMVVFMEGDIWPNFLAACKSRGIPTVVVNGRIGPRKGYPRYRLIRPLAARLFNLLTAISVQHESYAELFRKLGVDGQRLHVTGMVKFDTADIADDVSGQEALAAAMGIDGSQHLLVAGGTGQGEEELVLEAFAKARSAGGDDVRLAIVPRKPERFEAVARLIEQKGFALLRRSRCPDGSLARSANRGAVILGDTMGELRKFYSLAHAVFVGRSLVPEGGSDMIEAAALGKPVCFGPHTFNFPQADTMVEQGAAARVADAAELGRQFQQWLVDVPTAVELGKKAREFVASQRGATARNLELICHLLKRVPAAAEGGIATDALE